MPADAVATVTLYQKHEAFQSVVYFQHSTAALDRFCRRNFCEDFSVKSSQIVKSFS